MPARYPQESSTLCLHLQVRRLHAPIHVHLHVHLHAAHWHVHLHAQVPRLSRLDREDEVVALFNASQDSRPSGPSRTAELTGGGDSHKGESEAWLEEWASADALRQAGAVG